MLKNCRVESIPNPINIETFCPKDKTMSKRELGIPPNMKIILFGAANVLDKRKGVDYFIEALEKMKKEMGEEAENIGLLMFGKAKQDLQELMPFKTWHLSFLNSEYKIAKAYSAADVFVLPSLQDNLPNTIMESLACGTPVVAFDSGGIPEMVDHKENGYVATFKSSEDLANGIEYVLGHEAPQTLIDNSRKKVLNCYSPQSVAQRYSDIYRDCLY